MPADNFNWSDPTTWPWIIDVWIVLTVLSCVKPAWRWLQRRRAENWPTAEGYIEAAEVTRTRPGLLSTGSRSSPYVAALGYSYSTAAGRDAGWHKRDFPTEEEARAFVRDLKGKPVIVHYNPDSPSSSWLSESALDMLLRNSAHAPDPESYTAGDSVPEWIRPFLWAFAGVSAVGLALSLWVHGGAVLGRRVAPEAFFWILHLGIFVVWLPTVFVAHRLVGGVSRNDFWKVVLKGSPAWMRYMMYGFFAYATVNFLLFIAKAPNASSGGNPPADVWRGFSGHWMAFYSAALAVLYSAAHARR